MSELTREERLRKERSFGIVLAVVGGAIGGVQGSPLVMAVSVGIGFVWFLGATYCLDREGSA